MYHFEQLSVCCLIVIIMFHGQEISVIKWIDDHDVDRYHLLYLLSDGQFREERGFFRKHLDNDQLIWVVKGRYGYTSPEGRQFNYKYIADENGYRQTSYDPKAEDEQIMRSIDPKALISLVG